MLRSTKKVSQTNKAIVMQEFTREILLIMVNPLGVKGLMNKEHTQQTRQQQDHFITKINARQYKLTMIQNVSHIALGHFIAKLSQHGVFQQSSVDITSTVCLMSLHQHLSYPTTLSYILEKLEFTRISTSESVTEAGVEGAGRSDYLDQSQMWPKDRLPLIFSSYSSFFQQQLKNKRQCRHLFFIHDLHNERQQSLLFSAMFFFCLFFLSSIIYQFLLFFEKMVSKSCVWYSKIFLT